MKKNRLHSLERIKHLKTIEKVFSKNAFSVYGAHISARYTLDKDSKFSVQVGFSVSKRHYKKAVDRNKLKRWMREAYRTNKEGIRLPIDSLKISIALFFILHKKLETWTYQAVETSILELLPYIVKKIERNASLDKDSLSKVD